MAADIPFTVLDALITCGIDNDTQFHGQTHAEERIASNIFDDTFSTCMDLTLKELDEHFKKYSELSQAQGQIRILPGTRKNMKAFVQWTRDEIRLGRDPSLTPFPLGLVSDCLRRYKTHAKYVKDSSTLAEAAKPGKFKENTKWED